MRTGSSYILRFTHEKKRPRKIRTKYTTNQWEKRTTVKIHRPIRDANDNASRRRATSAPLSVMRVPNWFSLKDLKTHEQEDKNTRVETDRDFKPAKNHSSKKGRSEERWISTSGPTLCIARRVRTYCQNQRRKWLRALITALEKTPRRVQQLDED